MLARTKEEAPMTEMDEVADRIVEIVLDAVRSLNADEQAKLTLLDSVSTKLDLVAQQLDPLA
jgi:hypothetical protein